MKGGVVGAVYADEFLFQALELALALAALRLDQGLQLLVEFVQVVLPALYVLLSLEQEDLLLLVVLLNRLGEGIFPVLQHLDEKFKFLIQLRQSRLLGALFKLSHTTNLTLSCSAISFSSSSNMVVSPVEASIFFKRI